MNVDTRNRARPGRKTLRPEDERRLDRSDRKLQAALDSVDEMVDADDGAVLEPMDDADSAVTVVEDTIDTLRDIGKPPKTS